VLRGDDDDAADRVGAVQRRRAALEHLYALDGLGGYIRQVHVGGTRVVATDAVDDHEDLAGTSAAERRGPHAAGVSIVAGMETDDRFQGLGGVRSARGRYVRFRDDGDGAAGSQRDGAPALGHDRNLAQVDGFRRRLRERPRYRERRHD
jgi:hypothetical protein